MINIDEIIGDNIKHIRKNRDISRQRLADVCGVTYQQIQKYEKGVDRVSASRLYQIGQFLETSIQEFYPL